MTGWNGRRTIWSRVTLAAFVTAALSWSLSPYLWQFITSFKPAAELSTLPPILPSRFDLASYSAIFEGRGFWRVLLNSWIVASATTLLCLVLGSTAAFAVVYLPLRRKGLLLGCFLSIAMLPQISTLSPLYSGATYLGLRDTYTALIAPYTALGLPLAVWFLSGYLGRIPPDLYRAARVDGCSPFQAFRNVVFPLAIPGIVTTGIFVFILAWNELLYALVLTATDRARTIPVEIALFAGLQEIPWGEIAAASILVSLPLVVGVFLLQRRIVSGLLAGALKG